MVTIFYFYLKQTLSKTQEVKRHKKNPSPKHKLSIKRKSPHSLWLCLIFFYYYIHIIFMIFSMNSSKCFVVWVKKLTLQNVFLILNEKKEKKNKRYMCDGIDDHCMRVYVCIFFYSIEWSRNKKRLYERGFHWWKIL